MFHQTRFFLLLVYHNPLFPQEKKTVISIFPMEQSSDPGFIIKDIVFITKTFGNLLKYRLYSYPMRGKTTCPQCGEKYSLDLPDDATGIYPTTCPKCDHSFKIDLGEKINLNDDDTPLIPPSLHVKPRSHKPLIAGVFLIIVFLAGILLWGPLYLDHEDVLGDVSTRMQWNVSFQGKIVNETGVSLSNVTIVLENESGTILTDAAGKFNLDDIPWGYHLLHLSKTNFTTTHITIFVLPFHLWETHKEYTLIKGDSEISLDSQMVEDMNTYIPPLSILFLVFSGLALLGGLFSLQRKIFPLSLLGAILGIFTLGVFLIGFILSIAAVIFLVYSRYEFSGKKNEIIY